MLFCYMLSLTVADRGEAILPDPRDPLVQTWRDYDGRPCAYAYIIQGEYWLHVPNVASFRFTKTAPEITAIPEASARQEKILDIFSRVVLPIALHTKGMEVLHASAIVTDVGLVAFCAMADTGKSTTAYALSKRGYQQWADDAVPFEIENDRVTAVSLPFGVRLDPDAEQFLSAGKATSKKIRTDSTRIPIAALIVLKRKENQWGGHPGPPRIRAGSPQENDCEVTVATLSPSKAFCSVLLHGHFFNLKSPELMRQMVSNYMKLTSLVPVYEVSFSPGFERLSLLLDRLELLFAELSRKSAKMEKV